MPNWCSNVVTFKHRDPKLIARVVRGFNKGGLMAEFFPCPKELVETMAGSYGRANPEAKEHEIQQKLNRDKYGYTDWYAWQTNEWGTKWDVGRDQKYGEKITVPRGAKEVTLTFESAWSPPIGFYEKMHDQQQFDIEAKYFEPGCGFVGRWENGEDEHYSFDNTSRSWFETNVPADLLDEFGILDFFNPEDEEEENEEDDEGS